MPEELSDRYSAKDIESRIYSFWEEGEYFKAEETSTKPPYAICLPPPNVTGTLHLGHALDHTIQDVLIRWKRMSGYNTLWQPGTDHAGIATQSVVERELKKENKTRKDLGRDKFVKRVWEWKEEYGGRIVDQMKRLGDSCDWSRLRFTMDEGLSTAVRKVFVTMYEEGLIYRGKKLVNWDPEFETAVSDLEVEHREEKGHLWNIKYPLSNSEDFLVVATTRPETLLGDTAICVHPSDPRYQKYIGQKVKLPLTDREIEVIADDFVEKDFGSGVVKVTPAHDFTDYEVGKRHDLDFLNILNTNGTLNENTGTYQGLSVKEARKKVIADLEEQGLLVKEEPYKITTPICQRSGAVIEPYLSSQWFVAIDKMATPARHVVESGTITFEPELWTKTYLHWMNNIQDWCISRQLWWGHRIPAWYCEDCTEISVSETTPEQCKHCGSSSISQDEDVLDTWFSSALWPFSTLGWPEKTEALKTFYPTNVLVTGHDIIFFWVARMIMDGLHFLKDVPFRKVFIHGIIRDSQGRKMSKSVGNTVDPLQIIETHGADALRFTLMAQISGGRDLKFSEQRLEGYRNFINKIWNATRFSLNALGDFKPTTPPSKNDLSLSDKWITYKLGEVEQTVDDALNNYRFSDAAQSLYSFVWHDFCDWYLEFIKPIIYGEDSTNKNATQYVLVTVLNRICRLLHPFIPFVTEEIYQKLPNKTEACVAADYPTKYNDKDFLEFGSEQAAEDLDLVRDVIAAIRNIRGENRIKPGVEIQARLAPNDGEIQKVLGNNKTFILQLAKVSECEIGEAGDLSKCAVTPVQVSHGKVDVIVPLEGLVDFDEEIKRLEKTIEKTQKEIRGIDGRLQNKNFVSNAPDEVVEESKENLHQLKSRLQSLQESLTRFR